ncbi:FCD domain-containing protein [Sphingobium sp.]|uniref:FCD domain-containing protein n=1 Tax=Sphingobium sp. TaxID=1912891 RepID=UPI0028BD7826|nr:FCD domain-containing protein [Sphingobium sp.]
MKEPRVADQRSRTLVGGTLATDILHRLRDDIISCALPPGERLRFENLREIYGASFSTLREALSCLASERLVVSEGQRGFAVAPISREDLLDLTDARVLIERECVARSMLRGGSAWKSEMLAAYHRLDRVEAQQMDQHVVSPEWDARHFDFHESLVATAASPTMMEIRKSLFERARRYRRLSALMRKSPRAKRDEHRGLLEAMTGGDVELAQNMIESHIRATASNVLDSILFENQPATLTG